MKVLVTGGAGFVGSHIVDQLLAAGVEVRVLDLQGPSDLHDLRAEWVVGDVRSRDVVERVVQDVDAVCHQAAKVGLGVDFGDAHGYVTTNDVGTAVLLEALWRRCFRGRFVLASSMVVYGEGLVRCARHGVVRPGPRKVDDLAHGRFEHRCPQPGCRSTLSVAALEEHSGLDPRNVYAATKLHQEHLCRVWGEASGATAVALRYHNVYGARMPRDTPYAGVAAIFVSALCAGRSPQVFEDGGQTRDFVHVGDVARANVLALTAPDVESGAYNVASGRPRTVGQMAAALSGVFGPAAPEPEVTGQWRSGDVRHIVASPAKAAERLGFVAEVGFEDGMAQLVATSRLPADISRC